MNKTDKVRLLKFLTEEINASKVSIFAEFSRLTVKGLEDLRKEMKRYSTRVMVVKNTLVKMALKSHFLDEAAKFMEGPNMLIWSKNGDESEIIKEVLKFSKSSGNIKLKFGVLNNELLNVETLEKLGSLPSKKTLQAMVIGGIKSPLSGLVYNIKYPLTRFILILKTFSEQKEKGND
ncbi:MAG: 50S ribosomal protein L10 [Candidatus Omnitrophica bacterium]|nr:50S ribosomal protein L10 [Candidatus Omnitrophota bacterium]MCM8828810.1 50S ribosomal protein L10 [Candidatus Omnitrophota bacterium]